jgi:hypothetical protein
LTPRHQQRPAGSASIKLEAAERSRSIMGS